MRFLYIAGCMCLLFFCAVNVNAAFKSVKDAQPDKKVDSNPDPMPDDIILPMPCGETMVLRAVRVPSGAVSQDIAFKMGVTNAQENNRQLYEKQFDGHIAAPFTMEDLPQAWCDILKSSSSAKGDTWYFIGKYEVSNQQWNVVMRGLDANGEEIAANCPAKNAKDGDLPVTSISWFEVQEFLNKYNAWLVAHPGTALPAFTGTSNIAFLRLPTEEEWEYAARGGDKVSPEWWADKDIFPLDKDKSLRDYGLYNEGLALSAPAPIGSRNPNPLGLYDTVGNVREMVDGFFRMTVPDMRNGQVERRLHGAAGGILAKGGSFATTIEGVVPGSRDEVPLFTARGPGRHKDLGFRLVMAALNIPSGDRQEILNLEEKNIPLAQVKAATKPLNLSKNNPLEAIDAIAAAADDATRKNLNQLKSMIEDREAAQANQNAKNLEHTLRSLLYQAETLRAFAYRYVTVNQNVQKIEKVLKEKLSEADRKTGEDILRSGKSDLADYLHSLQMSASYYKLTLDNIAEANPAEVKRLLNKISAEYADNTVFGEHMEQNSAILQKFLRRIEEHGPEAINTKQILQNIIPERHYKVLPL